jgi:hypothetical protein
MHRKFVIISALMVAGKAEGIRFEGGAAIVFRRLSQADFGRFVPCGSVGCLWFSKQVVCRWTDMSTSTMPSYEWHPIDCVHGQTQSTT